MRNLVDVVREKVGRLVDPETGLTFSEMRLVREIHEIEAGVIRVDFRPSSPVCPIALKLAMDIKKAVLDVEGIGKALVYCRDHTMEKTINDLVNSTSEE